MSAPAEGSPRAGSGGESRDVALRVSRLTKRFGELIAVRGADFDVYRGEFLTLLGPSGCGKTTLLNLIAGFLEPDEGDIFIDGERINEVPVYKRDIGVVFQSYALFPHVSVAKNVGFGLEMRNQPRSVIEERTAAALEMVRLGEYADRRPRELSGGQRQRVALARALVIEPRVLLLDEPLSALDKNLRAEMQVELKLIQRQVGITTIFVTHDQGEALSLSDRVAVMMDGVVQQLSTPGETYRNPRNSFVASFIGTINRLPARIAAVEGDRLRLAIGDGSEITIPGDRYPPAGRGDEVWVFIRPEAMSIGQAQGAIATGRVRNHVYQGAHVDVLVEAPGVGLVNVRVADHRAMDHHPVGAQVHLSGDLEQVVLFPREGA